MTKPLLATA